MARRSVEENSVRIVFATHPAHILEPRPARLPKGHGVLATTQSNDESRGFSHFSLRSYSIYGARIALRSLPRGEGHQVAPHATRAFRASFTEDQRLTILRWGTLYQCSMRLFRDRWSMPPDLLLTNWATHTIKAIGIEAFRIRYLQLGATGEGWCQWNTSGGAFRINDALGRLNVLQLRGQMLCSFALFSPDSCLQLPSPRRRHRRPFFTRRSCCPATSGETDRSPGFA